MASRDGSEDRRTSAAKMRGRRSRTTYSDGRHRENAPPAPHARAEFLPLSDEHPQQTPDAPPPHVHPNQTPAPTRGTSAPLRVRNRRRGSDPAAKGAPEDRQRRRAATADDVRQPSSGHDRSGRRTKIQRGCPGRHDDASAQQHTTRHRPSMAHRPASRKRLVTAAERRQGDKGATRARPDAARQLAPTGQSDRQQTPRPPRTDGGVESKYRTTAASAVGDDGPRRRPATTAYAEACGTSRGEEL